MYRNHHDLLERAVIESLPLRHSLVIPHCKMVIPALIPNVRLQFGISEQLLRVSDVRLADLEEASRLFQIAYDIHGPQFPAFGKHWSGSQRLPQDPQFNAALFGMGVITT